jgi:prevent-host-death family protein
MKQVRSDEIRRRLRELMNAVERDGEHVTILRYDEPVAVIVPVDWHEQAETALADADGLNWAGEVS